MPSQDLFIVSAGLVVCRAGNQVRKWDLSKKTSVYTKTQGMLADAPGTLLCAVLRRRGPRVLGGGFCFPSVLGRTLKM